MSSKLIKNGSNVVLIDDRVIGIIRILESGAIQCECPNLHPALVTDLQYASFAPSDVAKIVQPPNVV